MWPLSYLLYIYVYLWHVAVSVTVIAQKGTYPNTSSLKGCSTQTKYCIIVTLHLKWQEIMNYAIFLFILYNIMHINAFHDESLFFIWAIAL